MKDIRLYLAGQRADLSSGTSILFNYTVTDTTHPQAVKNSYTKTVTLPGTQNNNTIFGDIWDLSRLQTYGNGNYSGVEFNPLKKADFELYIDGELYETGYFKLTDITKTGNNIEYSLTLYGGLGEFLYNLMYSEAGNKLEFKDLKLTYGNLLEPSTYPDVGFNINKETVAEAWNNIYNPSSKFNVINFAPCYNGLPDDFDANKVLINTTNKGMLNNVLATDIAASYNKWAMGEMSRDMTEWETRDLRSYLQRPIINTQVLIESCCNPENNGGYEVVLDEHFFDPVNNPYYGDAWMTLPMIKDIQGIDEDDTQTITGATMVKEGNTGYYRIETSADFSEYDNVNLDLAINLSTSASTRPGKLYTSIKKKVKSHWALPPDYVSSYYEYWSSVLVQLVAYDAFGAVVATSNAYELTSKVPTGNTFEAADLKAQFGEDIPIPEWQTLYGYFLYSFTKSTYLWVDENGEEQHLSFSFPSTTKFNTLKLRIQRPYNEKCKYYHNKYNETGAKGSSFLYSSTTQTVQGNHSLHDVRMSGATIVYENYELGDFSVTATRYGGFLSNKYISHNQILTLGITPADFLLSYIKLFGLYIWKDPVEKKIYIADRNAFYDTTDIVDLEDIIDRSKPIKITPQVAASKWYDFNTEQHDSEANSQYESEYGMEYGLHRVNTGYEFDSANTSVYEGSFKGGVQVLEKSPYYYTNISGWPAYCYNGFVITTYSQETGGTLNGEEDVVNPKISGTTRNPINTAYSGFDLFDKVQFHTADNSASDGDFVLLFYGGKVNVGTTDYWLTDDLNEMVAYNDKNPCWLMTDYSAKSGNIIALSVTEIPYFTRQIGYGRLTHMWDYGKPMETYVPDTYVTNGCSVFEKCWNAYITDMYDVNNRIVNCNCLIKGQVNNGWLRRFYYFDNSYWRLNSVKEWNPGSYETTNLEFIKVIDLNNYRLEKITMTGSADFYLPDYEPTSVSGSTRYYTVGGDVTSVTVNIMIQDGGNWMYAEIGVPITYDNGTTDLVEYEDITASHTISGGSHRGDFVDAFNIGANTSGYGRVFRFGISNDFDVPATNTIYLRQEAE